ncbi:hypothetical protein [Bacillus infantis]|uniref:hypothetical protein n=1 Tax=Bacillus infantis TaxID=324767 RepID=UPI003CF648FE
MKTLKDFNYKNYSVMISASFNNGYVPSVTVMLGIYDQDNKQLYHDLSKVVATEKRKFLFWELEKEGTLKENTIAKINYYTDRAKRYIDSHLYELEVTAGLTDSLDVIVKEG